MSRPLASAFRRLLIYQASWTYERLQGIGMGYASLPLLESLRTDPERYREAVGRSVEYFNAHPYLAGIAVGAAARAERDGLPGATVARLRTALSGPLGALGDQLFWIGVLPAVMGAALAGVAMGGGAAPILIGWVVYLGIRLWVTRWGLRLGLESGTGVAAALRRSGLADLVRRVGLVAGFSVGVALPLVVDWLALDLGAAIRPAGLIGAVLGVVAAAVRFRVPPARRVTLIAMGVVLLWDWSVR